ncbi:M23 family metallopeptidase [Robertkochia aurantiaca]|uniref:M23 family metallopeptidase n=1 Tax=Robertkochia aurantiaca TaxID=2873700 RepID=UPI001CCD795D|nr:M23 family metallopeptidase [Robertkochia sp. 3YJGBD-33]
MFICSLTSLQAQRKADEPLSYTDDLELEWQNVADTLLLRAASRSLIPVQIYFHGRINGNQLNSFLLMPGDSLRLLAVPAVKSDTIFKKRFRDSVRVSYYFGHRSLIDPDLDHLYRLPFKRGKKYEVSQSFNGKSSHFSEKSKYAVDFQLDVGEPVYAARSGMVFKVIDWFTKQGGEELKYAANKIVIRHDDGTMASYVHLDYRGSFVKEGDWVEEGEKIGFPV